MCLLENLAENLGLDFPEDRPPYLKRLRALLFYDFYHKDFEELLDGLLDQWRALPVEERQATTEWLILAFRWGAHCFGDALWRGQRRGQADILTSELETLHLEWHGVPVPAPVNAEEEEAEAPPSVGEETAAPRLEWSTAANAVVRVPLSQAATWTRRIKNMGGPGARVIVALNGDVLATRLLAVRLTLDGTEYPIHVGPLAGGQTQCMLPLEPQGEHELQLTFHGRGAGGGFVKAGVMALAVAGGITSKEWETLQVFIG
ncbi:hypothetical protein [Corallococcus sp. Z5C101001]|uniref:hypothetical protein n=1 Tax=Corallococcus sp. Z5C101001 TaxID=2596829 RepID=UPI001180619C|nr:hypothetical protein [Corallococcus sp. Z5C101001]TSC31724.1 hypothetical protein FOF48_13820 [Corallococcus sp. Z5C101001]